MFYFSFKNRINPTKRETEILLQSSVLNLLVPMKGKGTLFLIIVDFILKVSSSYFPPGRNEPDWAGLTGANPIRLFP